MLDVSFRPSVRAASQPTHTRDERDHCVGTHAVRPTPLRVQQWVAGHGKTGIIKDQVLLVQTDPDEW
jgi:hypothetical protein